MRILCFGVIVLATVFATAQAAAFRDIAFGALHRLGYTDEQIADLLGIGRGQLAEQKSLRAHLSVWRLVSLPPDHVRIILSDYLRSLGVTVIEDPLLGEFLQEQVMQFRHARMAKMTLAPAVRKDIA